MAKVDGGYLAAKAFKKEGVKYIFTLCTAVLAPYYEGCVSEGIKVISMRSEQAAAMAADGWSRVTGTPGVAIFTSGPGFTNAYTGIANAYLNQSPAVFISRGRNEPFSRDMGGLAEIDKDYAELARPITKWARVCYDTKRIPEYVSTAFRNALAGKPGPAYLEMPVDVLFQQVEGEGVYFPTNYRTEARPYGDSSYVRQTVEMLLKAERPVIMAGGGVHWSQASKELQKFTAAIEAPVFLNALGRGTVPPDHPMFFAYARSTALNQADVVLLVGAPLDFRLHHGRPPAWAADAKVIQIDIDAAEIGRNREIDIGIVGDPKAVLSQLIDEVGKKECCASGWLAHLREIEQRRTARDEDLMKSDIIPIHPMRVVGELKQLLRPDDIVVGDGGFFVNFAARVLCTYKPGHWLDPGLMGCLGVGPGFAIAAKLAHPEKRVILIAGDGAFGFNGMELETMSRHSIGVVTIVGNNGSWGMEKYVPAWTGKPIAADLSRSTRYDLMAEALGCHGELVERPDQIRGALERAFAAGRPALVNVVLSDDAAVYQATGSGLFEKLETSGRYRGR